ncbi:unnamed protein product [Withania somnifera]
MKKVLRRNDSSRNSTNSLSFTVKTVRYVECQKNHAASVGGHVVDGCREYMPESTGGTLNCAACGCHRNFHRREMETDVATDCTSASSIVA